MNEKMRKQVEAAMQQEFGVEVEMNNITREQAARLAAEFLGTGRYEYTARLNGYDSWSAWDIQGREWRFSKDVSIAGPDSQKCELVTPILQFHEDIEILQELIRRLRKAGAKSDPTRGCGVHLHVSAKGHTPQTIRNLVNLMASHESLLKDALALSEYRISRYCRPVAPEFLKELNKKKPKTMSELADIWYETNGAGCGRNQRYNPSRYAMLNLHATFSKGTLEYRYYQFDAPENGRKNGLHAGRLRAYIQFGLLLSQMAKSVKCASPKEQQKENPKYAMRCFLLRLGMIGDEFATAREVFTKRLDGDAAFRTCRA